MNRRTPLVTLILATWFFAATASAEPAHRKGGHSSTDSLETLEPENGSAPAPIVTPARTGEQRRKLTVSNEEADIDHYQNMDRRVTVSLGMLVPMGDFQGGFNYAPLIGLHFVWEAIYPFAFTVGFEHSASDHKDNPQLGKLTVSEINIGTKASFPVGRVTPFIKVEGAFCYNDVSFGGAAGSTPAFVVSGNDTILTSMGVNAGMGIDFIVGREYALGIEATYHYPIPKNITLSDGTNFNLASPWASASMRLNF